jgi:hypothetical protein
VDDGQHARHCKAGCEGAHILLADAHLEEPGVQGGGSYAQRRREVAVEKREIGDFVELFGDDVAEGFAGADVSDLCDSGDGRGG